ncbi:MAG: aminopeptidase P family protein [Defluviitaleaceae bacterium]|nr:aminopeptidase P family protein [Defluviitaleaceae bacterium]
MLTKIRELMLKEGIDTYIVTKMDPHQSEYSHEMYGEVAFVSGFTGSNGNIVITKDKAGLWTDPRYFLQAQMQMAEDFELHKDILVGASNYINYALNITKEDGVIGFNGERLNTTLAKILLKKPNIKINSNIDFVSRIWKDRPKFSRNKIFAYGENYSGESFEQKLTKVKKEMLQAGASYYIISSLDDICWFLNIRSVSDTNPFNIFAYVVVTHFGTNLFIDTIPEDKEAIEYLEKNNINIFPYNDIFKYLENMQKVMYCEPRTNFKVYNAFKDKKQILIKHDITTNLKMIKNSTEKNNIKTANEKDAIVFTKLIYWIKTNVNVSKISEIDIVEKLEELRWKIPSYFCKSFETICGYGKNGAIIHYKPEIETSKILEPNGFVLVDSGSNFIEGTTDITRTIALGELTFEMKRNYTAVLKGNIALSTSKFPYGTRGTHIDTIARMPLWKLGLNYPHGTGHGIGHMLNVHEGPNSMSQNINSIVLEENMLLSNEPGIYINEQYGIRIENSVFIKKDDSTYFGNFLSFETVTFVPFEIDAILTELLTDEEKQWINKYHETVYNNLKDSLTTEEENWLRQVTYPL